MTKPIYASDGIKGVANKNVEGIYEVGGFYLLIVTMTEKYMLNAQTLERV